MDFARGEITRLDELRWAATERRIELLLRLGRHSEAVGDLSELVQRLPLRERFHEQLVLALYRSGRQAEALRAYEDARKTLNEELGLDPGVELRDLERAVLQQDPSLDWIPPSSEHVRRGDAPAEPADAPPPSVTSIGRIPVPLSPLIGRDAEVAPSDRASRLPSRADPDGTCRRGQDPPRHRPRHAADRSRLVRRLQPDR